MHASNPDIEVKGPIIDDETGARIYTARYRDQETTFSVIPVEPVDGEERWMMHAGPDFVVPTDPGFEAFESPEAAFEAGLRASREGLLGG